MINQNVIVVAPGMSHVRDVYSSYKRTEMLTSWLRRRVQAESGQTLPSISAYSNSTINSRTSMNLVHHLFDVTA